MCQPAIGRCNDQVAPSTCIPTVCTDVGEHGVCSTTVNNTPSPPSNCCAPFQCVHNQQISQFIPGYPSSAIRDRTLTSLSSRPAILHLAKFQFKGVWKSKFWIWLLLLKTRIFLMIKNIHSTCETFTATTTTTTTTTTAPCSSENTICASTFNGQFYPQVGCCSSLQCVANETLSNQLNFGYPTNSVSTCSQSSTSCTVAGAGGITTKVSQEMINELTVMNQNSKIIF